MTLWRIVSFRARVFEFYFSEGVRGFLLNLPPSPSPSPSRARSSLPGGCTPSAPNSQFRVRCSEGDRRERERERERASCSSVGMASHPHLDYEDDFRGDFPGSHGSRRTGDKRAFGDLDEDEDDVFGHKKGKPKVEESGLGATTGVILSLRESLQTCKDNLAACQTELEAAKSEVKKWHSAFQNEPVITAGTSSEPLLVVNYLQKLKSSEESLKEQLEKAKKREAAFIVTFAKREQEIADLKSAVRDLRMQLKPPSMQTRRLLLDPAIHEEFTRLKNMVEEKEKKIKELQDNIAAINFTPQSKNGKMLMAKCRTLQEENEEIGAMASEGKIHELAMKLALQKSQNAELRDQFEALYKHVEGLTNDMERSNEMVFLMQDKLEEKDYEIRKLKGLLSQRESQGGERDEDKVTDEVNSAEAEN